MAVMLSLIALAVAAPAHDAALDRAVADYDHAQIHGDGPALKRLLADDYVLANSGGATETKAEFIADLTDPTYHLKPYVVQSPIERTWANGAIRGGLARLTGTAGDKSFDACLRFVDVWRREGAVWRVAYSQAAKVAIEQCK